MRRCIRKLALELPFYVALKQQRHNQPRASQSQKNRYRAAGEKPQAKRVSVHYLHAISM
jgi:hypothetical protein